MGKRLTGSAKSGCALVVLRWAPGHVAVMKRANAAMLIVLVSIVPSGSVAVSVWAGPPGKRPP